MRGRTPGCISACQGCVGESYVPEIRVCQSKKTWNRAAVV